MQEQSDSENFDDGQLDPIPSFGQERPRSKRKIAELDALSDTFPEEDRDATEIPSFIPTTNLINIVGSGNTVGTDGK